MPEAITWHFAGTWNHMPELKSKYLEGLNNAFPKSIKLLNRSVSIPISVNMEKDFSEKIKKALRIVFK